MGHRSTEWCPRCGTSLSQHELSQSGVYQDRSDPSLTVRFPLVDRRGESLVIWTTTPWTLPANVAAAVHPDAEYGRRENGEWVMVARYPDRDVRRDRAGLGARRAPLRGPLRHAAARGGGRASRHPLGRGLGRGGNRDRPHRPGLRRRGLRAVPRSRPADPHPGRRVGSLLRRVRLAPRHVHGRCGRPDRRRPRRAWAARPRRSLRAPLPALLALRHAPHLPDLRRLVPLGRGAPPALARRERDRRVDARLHGQADGRLAAEHGRLEHLAAPLLRAPAAVLPLRVRAAERDRLEAPSCRARDGAVDGLEELRRPWVDEIRIRCESCGEEVERIAEVGDVWLDAGIVPFSTLGFESPEYVPRGVRDRRGAGPDHAPTCPTTRTGSSGSPRTGSRRCASRSGCGSTRSSSCRSR